MDIFTHLLQSLNHRITGSSPTLSAVQMFPFSLVSAITSMLAGFLITRTKAYRPIVWISFAIYTLGAGLMTMMDADSSVAEQEVYPLIAGIGLGCLFQAPMIAITAAMPPSEMATSTAALSLVRSASGTAGITIAGSIFNSGVRTHTKGIQGFNGGNHASTADLRGLIHLQPPELAQQVVHAYGSALQVVWIVMAPLVGVGFLATLGIKGYSLQRRNMQQGTPHDSESSNVESANRVGPADEAHDLEKRA